MKKTTTIRLGEIMANKAGSVDPSKYREEIFELYSISAFDSAHPEFLPGKAIGSTKQIVEPEDVLLSKIVPHIRRAWIVGNQKDKRIIASGEWIVFRSKHIEPRYLRHVLVSDSFHKQFMRTVSGVGGSLLRARPSFVANIEISVPPLDEQRRIAVILDKAHALRAKRQTAIAQLDKISTSIFAKLFSNSKDRKEWPQVQLQDVAEILTGYPFPSKEYLSGSESIKLCRGANVLPGKIDWSDLVYWPKNKVQGLSRFALSAGDVVLAMDRPWISSGLKIAQVHDEDCPALLVQRVARIRGREGIPNEFIFHLLNQLDFSIHSRPTETTVPHISPKDIQKFVFRLPPRHLQVDFVQQIKLVERLKRTCEASLAQMDSLFAALQHRAFRGVL